MKDNIKIKQLLVKFLQDDCSQAEIDNVVSYFQESKKTNDFPTVEDVFELFHEISEVDEITSSQIIRNILSDSKQKKHPFTKGFKISQITKYAAAIAILVSSTYFINNAISLKNKDGNQVSKNELLYGNFNENVLLKLSDGSIQKIGPEKEELSYLNKPQSEGLLDYNEITTPKGRVFRVILSDSTVVTLNADTKLKFPKNFTNNLNNRTVLLEGEAFFDVTHNKNKPFLVNTNCVNIEVLGTKFNVSSYDDDQFVNTTLVEGSVKVADVSDTQNSIIIEPSFQASLQKSNMVIANKKVNTLDYTSWMQRRMIFIDTPFENLLIKIERTYNVSISNENEQIKNERFTGEFDIENIETIFKVLSASFHFEYELENNKIVIKED